MPIRDGQFELATLPAQYISATTEQGPPPPVACNWFIESLLFSCERAATHTSMQAHVIMGPAPTLNVSSFKKSATVPPGRIQRTYCAAPPRISPAAHQTNDTETARRPIGSAKENRQPG